MPDVVCAVLSSWWWTGKLSETCTASYRNRLWNVASCWLYSANKLWTESRFTAKIYTYFFPFSWNKQHIIMNIPNLAGTKNSLIEIRYCYDLYSQSTKDATFLNLFISVRRCTCFRRFFRPSSGAQNCTYSVRYLSDQYLTLYVQFWAPDDGRKNRLKHVERLT